MKNLSSVFSMVYGSRGVDVALGAFWCLPGILNNLVNESSIAKKKQDEIFREMLSDTGNLITTRSNLLLLVGDTKVSA